MPIRGCPLMSLPFLSLWLVQFSCGLCSRAHILGGYWSWLGFPHLTGSRAQVPLPLGLWNSLTLSLFSLQRQVWSGLYLHREGHRPQAGSQGHQETDTQRQGSAVWLWGGGGRRDAWSRCLSPPSTHTSAPGARGTKLDAPKTSITQINR